MERNDPRQFVAYRTEDPAVFRFNNRFWLEFDDGWKEVDEAFVNNLLGPVLPAEPAVPRERRAGVERADPRTCLHCIVHRISPTSVECVSCDTKFGGWVIDLLEWDIAENGDYVCRSRRGIREFVKIDGPDVVRDSVEEEDARAGLFEETQLSQWNLEYLQRGMRGQSSRFALTPKERYEVERIFSEQLAKKEREQEGS